MINNVTLVGRLTKDPDLRYTASGTAVATFTLAVNRFCQLCDLAQTSRNDGDSS